MRSVFNFIVKPVGERYDNEVKVNGKSLILNTKIESFKSVNKLAEVVSIPLAIETDIKVGDIVSWSELSDVNTPVIFPQMKKRFGIASKLEIVFRGDRRVAIIKVIPMGLTTEKEVLAVCISLVSREHIHEV